MFEKRYIIPPVLIMEERKDDLPQNNGDKNGRQDERFAWFSSWLFVERSNVYSWTHHNVSFVEIGAACTSCL